jgi:hypothetical protein
MTSDDLAERKHGAAQMAQAAQGFGLLVAELETDVILAARRAADGHPAARETAAIAERMAAVTAEYSALQKLIWRHVTQLRALVL